MLLDKCLCTILHRHGCIWCDEGATYQGIVKGVKEYGAFVELVPGKEGLLHISEIAHERIDNVEDIFKVGDQVDVKLLKIEHGGRLKLSRKALLDPPKDKANDSEE